MSIATSNFQPVTAADVRADARANPEKYADLSEAALHTVAPGARGRIHPDVRAKFNEGRKPSERYSETAPRTIPVTYKHTTKSGSRSKTVYVVESEARALAGDAAGKRGPLSKAALVKVSEALANA